MMSPWAAAYPAVAHVLTEHLGDELFVSGPDGHHLQRVRRIRVGEAVTAADGAGRWRPYTVVHSTDGVVTLDAAGPDQLEPVLRPRLEVAFALTKGAHPELVVQAVTELGADRVVVVHGARSVVRWDPERAGKALTRLRRIARESVLQCRRSRLPEIDGPMDFGEVVDDFADQGGPDAEGGIVVAARDGNAPEALVVPASGRWLLLVGPEGGFDPAE